MSVCCKNCVVHSELTFAAEMVLSAAKQFSVLNCVGCSELVFAVKIVFAVEMVLSPANQCSLSKLCCLQRSSVRCQS
jgi:hypothetical protein